MNKSELIQEIASKTGLTKIESAKSLEAILETIQSALSVGNNVQIIGFGTFETRIRKAKEGRNPSTGKGIMIPEKRIPAFKAGKAFKEIVAPK